MEFPNVGVIAPVFEDGVVGTYTRMKLRAGDSVLLPPSITFAVYATVARVRVRKGMPLWRGAQGCRDEFHCLALESAWQIQCTRQCVRLARHRAA